MTTESIVAQLLDVLNSIGIQYMVVGSLSSTYYGIPRSTKDADLLLNLRGNDLDALVSGLGPTYELDPQMSFETVTGTCRYIISHLDSEFTIELFLLGEDEHEQTRFHRRTQLRLLDHDAYLPTVEDVIVTKLRWAKDANRDKDRNDIRDVLAVQGDAIDWDYLYGWCDKHETRELLDEIRATVPEI